jgi:hypothetical protein
MSKATLVALCVLCQISFGAPAVPFEGTMELTMRHALARPAAGSAGRPNLVLYIDNVRTWCFRPP